MKFPALTHLVLWSLCALCGSMLNCFSLDREAFSITNYDLTLHIETGQHRLGARGKVTLRNDSASPQKIAVLQVSSSLAWRSIAISGKESDRQLQIVMQPYTSDIDHTGELSEAIVTLPQAVPPHGTIDLDVAYEGVILVDATRLTRIGTPEDVAKSTDWDQIDATFTAVRGAGYVAWYPIATEAANLSDENSVSEVLGRLKTREQESELSVLFESTKDCTILFSGTPNMLAVQSDQPIAKMAAFSMIRPGTSVPTFVMADYMKMEAKGMSSVAYFPGRESAARSYADVLGSLDPLPEAHGPKGLEVAQLPDSTAAPFVSDNLLLIPFKATVSDENRLTLIYALARRKARSPQPWISEGLAHFAQLLDIENRRGRTAAIEYLNAHRSMLVESEKQSGSAASSDAQEPADHSLIDAKSDGVSMQSKAMSVWWMLRDMVGNEGIHLVLFSYSDVEDKGASYLQELFTKRYSRDLGWFFDDWVYRDRGLPDFKVESAFARKALPNAFLVTITVDNLGTAGAEVPIFVKFAGGTVTKRLEVRAKNKATIRVETPTAPVEITVNDGSVPESDTTNNVFKMEATETPPGKLPQPLFAGPSKLRRQFAGEAPAPPRSSWFHRTWFNRTMFARKILVEYEQDGKRLPCPLKWLDSFSMRNFTNASVFDETLPVADGKMEVGNRVPLDQLKEAMEDWFRRKGYLAKDTSLSLTEN